MRTFAISIGSTLLSILFASSANAALISVTGPNSLRGVAAAIISAPADVNDGAAFNDAQQGFNEVQNFILGTDISVDGGATILAGTVISSHMIFLNNRANENTLNTHTGVQWTFDGLILGVMSDYSGSLEIATSSFLGAPGTAYPIATFDARGIEVDDSYSFVGSVLTFNSRIRQPGDWIRVITASSAVPEPTSMLLLGGSLLGVCGAARRRRSRQ